MRYNTKSNDYFAAYNRRFDARIKKLARYGLLGKTAEGKAAAFQTAYDAKLGRKPIVDSSGIMHQSNRCYYEYVANALSCNDKFYKGITC